MFTLSLRCYQVHGELKMVSNQHIVNTNISWTYASTNLLGTEVFDAIQYINRAYPSNGKEAYVVNI